MLAKDQLLAGRYRIERQIGHGGMGAVYEAEHLMLSKRVAIKEMAMAEGTAEEQHNASLQFQAEGKILCHLSHASLPQVYDFFEDEGRQYLVMDFVEGITLEQALQRRGRFPEAEVRAIATQLCDVLEYLHGQVPPVIFRDLKPSNVMITGDNQIVLIDFGIAKIFERKTGRGTQTFARNVGSPGFAAPEQYSEGTDIPTDIYAFGATLYCLLTATVPPESVAIAAGVLRLTAIRNIAPETSWTLCTAIDRMMKLNTAERLPTIPSVRRALTRKTQDTLPRGSRQTVSNLSDKTLVAAQVQSRNRSTVQTLPEVKSGRSSRTLPVLPSVDSGRGYKTIPALPPPEPEPVAEKVHARPHSVGGGKGRPASASSRTPLVAGLVAAVVAVVLSLRFMGAPRTDPSHTLVVVTPSSATARLLVQAEPGVHVTIDGVDRGNAPVCLTGLAAHRVVEVQASRAGYTPVDRVVTLEAGENVVKLMLVRAPGTVVVNTVPKEVQIYIESRRAAETRDGHAQLQLPPGRYLLSFQAPHYQTVVRDLIVLSGQKQTLRVSLSPQAGLPSHATLARVR